MCTAMDSRKDCDPHGKICRLICCTAGHRRNEEVMTLAKQSLGFISQTTFPMGYLPVILSAIEHAAGTCKWHGKVMVLNFVQVCGKQTIPTSSARSLATCAC
jgi:hypothetical protein